MYIFKEVIIIKVSENISFAFEILGRKWNGIIIDTMHQSDHYVSGFSDLKDSIFKITPKALSLKLTELIEFGIVEKVVILESQPAKYRLTKKGIALAESLASVQAWSRKYKK